MLDNLIFSKKFIFILETVFSYKQQWLRRALNQPCKRPLIYFSVSVEIARGTPHGRDRDRWGTGGGGRRESPGR